MIEIQNLQNLVPDEVLAGMNDAAIAEVVLDIAESARHKWITIAQKELFTSKNDYIGGIQKVSFTPGMAVITLAGVLPNLIENGMDEVDLHTTLLGPAVEVTPPGKPGKHPRAAGGFYRAIPFRHGTPGTGGSVGQPMGRAYEGHEAVKDAAALGKKVYGAAKKLKQTTSQPGKGVAYGGRLPEGMAPKLREYHATDIYSGMIRQRKTYKKSTQSQYTTFRMIAVDAAGVGVGSSPWIRPKTPGKHFAEQVNAFVQKFATQAFEAYAGAVG